ncbi:zinc finger protein 37-like isoform X1 [Hydractinia symbiolongicarpus]|uniref:zinc finger protein 37-like isoform X1 n=1 Tax=Hydractinia symbiolongicarpus TaxID=13093 RepID=UPI00254F7D57|nr:zinc finger protein 37-like isoform X1 [Hydractinia symbiolongicarpus]
MDTNNAIANENQDVDKSLFDAEQFLSNYTNLREECDGLKTENHELQMRVQQLTQELNQTQVDKQNLERNFQKETLKHKETVWNLKLEIQRSQEERLSWKEKYLDLCIKSSQNATKELNVVKDARQNMIVEKDDRRVKKRGKKKVTKVKAKTEPASQPISNNDVTLLEEEANEAANKTDTSQENEPVAQQVELSLATTLPEETSNMPTADMVTSLDANLNSSASVTQNHGVTTDTTDYYSLQAAPFDLNNQGESGNTTTFILQTSDATFCATAVIDDQQRPQFGNTTTVPFTLKPSSDNSFNNTAGFPENMEDTDSDSDEVTEFNFRCNLCNFTYSDQLGLSKHMKAKHTAKTNLCKECGKAYSTKSSLAQHVHHYHKHPMAYTCEVCDKKFNRKDFLTKHQKTHTEERSFQCTHCDKQFKTSASLSAHVNGTHNETRRFVCDFCGMRTSWRISYLEHMKLHTGEPRKYKKKKQEEQQQREEEQQMQMQQQQQELEQLVGEPGPTVVQFITTAEG